MPTEDSFAYLMKIVFPSYLYAMHVTDFIYLPRKTISPTNKYLFILYVFVLAYVS